MNSTQPAMRMIIDSDAGVDDAHAIMMALAQSNVCVEAITTVTGNIDVQQVNRNVCTILDVMQVDVPIYPGAERPLVADWHWETEQFHGRDGLGDWSERPPSTRVVEQEHAVQAIIRLVNTYPGEITLVTLGPLTNLALAVRLNPALPARIRKLVLMGGTISAHGNTMIPAAEFNIHCDPEAAHVVLSSFPNVTVISWETTLGHPLPIEQYETLKRLSGQRADFFRRTNEKVMAVTSNYLLPDPLAMAAALCPELVLKSEHHRLLVELHGTLTRGQTLIDYTNRDHKPNAEIVLEMDMDGVFDLFSQMLIP